MFTLLVHLLFFFSCNIHMHIDIHTYMQTYKHLCLYMQYALACMHACMHAVTQTFAYTRIMHLHADTPILI